MANAVDQYMPLLSQASSTYGIPLQLLQQQVMANSGGDPSFSDHFSGAMGIMGHTPAMANEAGVQNPMDMQEVIQQTAQHLSDLYHRFGDWKSAIAALNSNPAVVSKYGGVPPIPETQAHVNEVLQGVGLPGAGAALQGSPTAGGAPAGLGDSAPAFPLAQQVKQFLQQHQQQQLPQGHGPAVLPVGAEPHRYAPQLGGGMSIVQAAKGYLGIPYKWGGTSRQTGMDCSGFIQSVFKDIGISLPRTTYDQVKVGQAVSLQQLQPGDVVFTEPGHAGPNHVGLYIGHGMIQNSPHTGTVNSILSLQDFLGGGFVAARRYTGMAKPKGKR